MRYLKHYFEDIIGIEIYPIISLLIFFTFFVLLTLYVVRMKKKHVNRMRNIPLDPDPGDGPETFDPTQDMYS